MRGVIDLLAAAERVSVFCHENPDADTLGAALALAIAVERLGKEAEVVSVDVPAPFLDFLPRVATVRRTPALDPDLAVIVDAGDLSRIGAVLEQRAEWFAASRVANIDHHVSNPRFGDAAWVDPAAAATCEMVAMLLPELGVEIDAELATCLMAGIVQDTHTFAHPNATPRTLRLSAELLEAGAPLSAINRAVYADKPFSTIVLWGRVLGSALEQAQGRIVHASVTTDLLTATGELPSAAEGLVDILASTRRADVAILFKEQSPMEVRASVRTTERADAVSITSAFGGGGHPRAAGCTIRLPLERARERLLAEAQRELSRGDDRSR